MYAYLICWKISTGGSFAIHNGDFVSYFGGEMPIWDCCTFLCVRAVSNLLYGVTGISISKCTVFCICSNSSVHQLSSDVGFFIFIRNLYISFSMGK